MTRRINKPLPHPYDNLFKNGENSFEKSNNLYVQNISAASNEVCTSKAINENINEKASNGFSPLCLAAFIFIIFEIYRRDDK